MLFSVFKQQTMQHLARRCALALILCLGLYCIATANADDKKQHKREKFGSSLKRLKWDEAKKASVEKPEKSKGKKPQEPSDAALTLKTLLVTFDVLVTDASHTHIIQGLNKDDFIVTEDDQPQQVATFTLGNDVQLPRSIILLIDWSSSQEPYLEKSACAAKALINQLGPADEMAIITDDIELVCDYTHDKARLSAALDEIEHRRFDPVKRSRSCQFSSLFAALREMVTSEQRRPIILFQTDGDEAASFRDQPDAKRFSPFHRCADEYGLSDIFDAARKSRATIYSIMTNERLVGLTPTQLYQRGRMLLESWQHMSYDPEDKHGDYQIKLYSDLFLEGQKAAARVAMLTGGWMAYLEKPEQAEGIYDTILKDINQRYIIGYYPTNEARDGKQRNVKITVRNHPEYYVHGRTSYVALNEP
jgi:VWFA-related protein